MFVAEPSVEDTIANSAWPESNVLRAAPSCAITDPVRLRGGQHYLNRYIADRQLPDKAIDLIDEAASSIRMQTDSAGGADRPRPPHYSAQTGTAGVDERV